MTCQAMAKRTHRAKRPREIVAPEGPFHPRACYCPSKLSRSRILAKHGGPEAEDGLVGPKL